MTKCYSINEEEFNLDNIGEVIEHIEDNLDEGETALGMKYWEADAVPFTHSDVISTWAIEHFLESLDERMGDEIMDFDCLYTDVSHKEKEVLVDLIKEWAEKYVNVGKYHRVVNVQERTIEIEDLE